jgi:hypothetical protein
MLRLFWPLEDIQELKIEGLCKTKTFSLYARFVNKGVSITTADHEQIDQTVAGRQSSPPGAGPHRTGWCSWQIITCTFRGSNFYPALRVDCIMGRLPDQQGQYFVFPATPNSKIDSFIVDQHI